MQNFRREPDKRPNLEQWGKIPPQAVDVEMAVLGAFILETDAYNENPVNPDIFYKHENQKICEVIQQMAQDGRNIDMITLTQRLKETQKLEEVGGPVYIMELTSKISAAYNLPEYILILKDKFLRRQLIGMSQSLINTGFDESQELDEAVEAAQTMFLKMLQFEENNVLKFGTVAFNLADIMTQNANSAGELTGVTTGLKKMDDFTYGLQKGDLVIVGGHTSHGKTTLAINLAKAAAIARQPVGFWSLEMSALQLTARIIATESGISSKTTLYEKMAKEQYLHVENHIYRLKDLPIFYDQQSTSSITSICASIRRMVLKFGIRVAFVDYLQLVSGNKSQGREEEVGQMARAFKNLAKEMDITIVLLSQMRRGDNPEPTMKELRSSGQIEEAADVVMLIWIPEIEGIDAIKDGNGQEHNMKGKCNVIIGKGRNIGTTDFILNINRPINRIWDYNPAPFTATPKDAPDTRWMDKDSVDGSPF